MIDHRDVYLNFIQGQWRQGSSGQWDTNRNPAKPMEILGKSTRSNAADVDRAVESASQAQLDWSLKPRSQRGALIQKAGHLLRGKAESYAKALSREQGKNLTEARAEVQKTVLTLESLAAESRRAQGELACNEAPQTLSYAIRSPHGVVAILTSHHAALFTPAARTAAALLEGNTVVLKPSTLTPGIAAMLVRLFEEAGAPAGVLNLVYGPGNPVGSTLAQDARIRAVSIQCTRESAAEIQAIAAKRFSRVQLDSQPKQLAVVLADADLDLAAEAVTQSSFTVQRIVVESSIHSAFREKLLSRIRSVKVGDGLVDPNALGPVADERVLKAAMETIEAAKQEGAQVICGGERVGAVTPDAGYFLAPTVLDGVTPQMKVAREAIPGPVVSLLAAQDLQGALRLANAAETTACALYTKDIQQALQIAHRLSAATLSVNAPVRDLDRVDADFFAEMRTVQFSYAGR